MSERSLFYITSDYSAFPGEDEVLIQDGIVDSLEYKVVDIQERKVKRLLRRKISRKL